MFHFLKALLKFKSSKLYRRLTHAYIIQYFFSLIALKKFDLFNFLLLFFFFTKQNFYSFISKKKKITYGTNILFQKSKVNKK